MVLTTWYERSYWRLLGWLSRDTMLPEFWTLDEAAEHYRDLLRSRPNDRVRGCYVLARFFARHTRRWLNDPSSAR